MPLKKSSTKSRPKHLKQTTLFDNFSSSPARPSVVNPSASKRKIQKPVVQVSSDSGADDSDNAKRMKFEPADDDVPSPRKRRKLQRIQGSDSPVEEVVLAPKIPQGTREGSPVELPDTDAEVQPRRRRKLIRGVRPRETATDEGDISDEVDQDKIIESRLRTRGKMSVFQQNLEKLKRKKLNVKYESSEHSSTEESDEQEDEPFSELFRGAKPSDVVGEGSSEGSDASGDFIVEDDNADSVAVLPVQFSMDARQDLAHTFKKIFQFFVHIAVRPEAERSVFMQHQMKNEEYFSVPLNVARRKIIGLRDSLVTSSVWKPDFKRPLDTYPCIELLDLDFAVPHCDACNLSGRMSTITARLSGEPYDRMGFMALSKSADSGVESESDEESDENEESIKQEFSLGRFCARRTRVYHELTHWEYTLFYAILAEVDMLHASKKNGKNFVRVGFAGGREPPEDLEDADAVCEWLDERNVIDNEWHIVKQVMEGARHLDMVRKKGEDD